MAATRKIRRELLVEVTERVKRRRVKIKKGRNKVVRALDFGTLADFEELPNRARPKKRALEAGAKPRGESGTR